MQAEVIEAFESFFVRKIRKGLEGTRAALSADDLDLLLVSMNRLPFQAQLAIRTKTLILRCVEALRLTYAQELKASGEDAEVEWHRNNALLYRTSERLISCVVQNWYLTSNWSNTQSGRRPRALYTWYSPLAQKIWDDYIVRRATRRLTRRDSKTMS